MTAWTEDHFIAGEVVLDFANTVYRRKPALGADLLDDDSLSTWLHHAGLTSPSGSGVPLAAAQTLRTHLWAMFDAQASGQDLPPETLAAILTTANRGGVTVTATGKLVIHTPDGPLAALALHALRLALTPALVRTCDRCGWFFTDTSKARRRRWCSMKTCGNQAKAARHRDGGSVRRSA